MAMRRTNFGFTLIELMIVVAIVAILAAIAYPSYNNHVLKTRRGAAAACAMEAAQYMERYYTTNLTYVGAALPATQCQQDLQDFYTVTLGGVAANTYSISATPKGAQLKDTKCGILGINEAGNRTINSGLPDSDGYCW